MKLAHALRPVAIAAAALALAMAACEETTPDTFDAGGPIPVFDSGVEAGPVTCDTPDCQPADFRAVATLPACCTVDGACGLQLAPASPYLPTPAGCTAVSNPGVSDDQCPSYAAPSSLYKEDLQGCCRGDHTCGIFVALADTLDLGCVPARGFLDDAGVGAPCGLDDGGAGDAASDDGGDAQDADPDVTGD